MCGKLEGRTKRPEAFTGVTGIPKDRPRPQPFPSADLLLPSGSNYWFCKVLLREQERLLCFRPLHQVNQPTHRDRTFLQGFVLRMRSFQPYKLPFSNQVDFSNLVRKSIPIMQVHLEEIFVFVGLILGWTSPLWLWSYSIIAMWESFSEWNAIMVSFV